MAIIYKYGINVDGSGIFSGSMTLGSSGTIPNGGSLLNLSGTTASMDRSAAPDIVFKVSDSDYPIKHLLSWSSTNISELVGCYYDSGYKSGKGTSGWRNWYNGLSHRQEFKVTSGNTEGGSASFTDSYHIDLTSGDVSFKQDVSVLGSLSATLSTAAQPNITSVGTLTNLDVDDLNINGTTIASSAEMNFDCDSDNSSSADYFSWTTNNGATELMRLTDEGQASITQTTAGDALTLLSSNSTQQTGIGLGRTAVESNIAQVASSSQYFTDAYEGDLAIRNIDSGKALLLGISTTATMTILPNKVGLSERSPYNLLDVSGGAVIGSSYSGAETAPTNGLLIEGSVGVGTASASTKLHVVDNTTPAITVGTSSNTDGRIYFGNSNHGIRRNYSGLNDVGLYTTSGKVFLSANGVATNNFRLTYSGSNTFVSINDSIDAINTLDVSGAVGIGADVSGVETAPSNGLLVQGNIYFYGTGQHKLYFTDPDTGIAGRSGLTQETDGTFSIFNNSATYDIDIYNNQGWLKHRGYNGSYSYYSFKTKSDTGDTIIGANVSAVEDEEMVSNNTGSGRSFGSVNFYLDESNNKLKFKVRYTNESSKAITNVTQANPAVVTCTAHGYSNGDKIEIVEVSGMTELNQNLYTVANADTNTFELSGTDSTSYTAYSSGGNAQRTRFKDGELSLT